MGMIRSPPFLSNSPISVSPVSPSPCLPVPVSFFGGNNNSGATAPYASAENDIMGNIPGAGVDPNDPEYTLSVLWFIYYSALPPGVEPTSNGCPPGCQRLKGTVVVQRITDVYVYGDNGQVIYNPDDPFMTWTELKVFTDYGCPCKP